MSIQSITLLLFLNALIKIHFFKFKLNITVYKEQCSLATSVILIRWLVWVIVHDLIAHRWLLRDIFNFHALVQKKCAWNNLNILKDRKKDYISEKPQLDLFPPSWFVNELFLYDLCSCNFVFERSESNVSNKVAWRCCNSFNGIFSPKKFESIFCWVVFASSNRYSCNNRFGFVTV